MAHENTSSIQDSFNDVAWHDTQLLDIAILDRDGKFAVEMNFNLIEGYDKVGVSNHPRYKSHKLRLNNCHSLRMDVDLQWHRQAQFQISHASASVESEWKTAIANDDNRFDFSRFVHFRIELCPPFGSIDLLAVDFELIPFD